MIIPTIDWRTKNLNSTEQPVTHELHPTFLEWFMKCKYKSKYDKDKPSENARDAFYTWDIVEQLMTAYQYWEKLGDEVLRNFGNSMEFSDYNMLYWFSKIRKDYIKDAPDNIKDRYPLFTQKRMSLRILMDADQNANSISIPAYHEIYLTWTADRVYSDYTIADCKTAKSKRWKNEVDFRCQWRIYPRMRKQTSHLQQLNKPTFDFTYVVFVKTKTPWLQIIPLTYSYEDSERLVFHLLTEYIKAYDNDEWNPSKCLDCRRCKLREQCPIYWADWMASFTANHTPEDSKDIPEERRF